MMITTRSSLLALSMFTFACSGATTSTSSGSTASASFAEVAPAAGPVALASGPAAPVSGFVFTNQGATDVTVDQIEVTLATCDVVRAPAGVGVPAGGSPVTFLFDSSATHEVTKLSFAVQGSTAKLVVDTTNATGYVPAHR
jgi:hypothetical protein